MEEKALFELHTGESGTVTNIYADRGMCRRYADIGCLIGARICKLGVSPFGDPAAYLVCGAVIAIRKKDAEKIRVFGIPHF